MPPSPAVLSLHSASLTALATSLSCLLLSVGTLTAPTAPGFHGVYVGETRRLLHALALALSEAAAILSSLGSTATECVGDARRLQQSPREEGAAALRASLCRCAGGMESQLSGFAGILRQIAYTAESATSMLGEAEREFAWYRGPLGLDVVSSEEAAAAARKAVLDAGRRVAELDGILADARREAHEAARKLFFARFWGAVGVDARKTMAIAKMTRDVLDRAARDRVALVERQAETQAFYLRRSAESRRSQRALLEKDECWREAVEKYGALRSLAGSVREVAATWDLLARSCREVGEWEEDVENGDEHPESTETLVEYWHTISVALRLFNSDHTDSVQSVFRLLEL